MDINRPRLAVPIGKLNLANPIMTASGTFGYGAEFAEFLDLNKLGGIIVKGISVNPRKGNPPPRIVETACGMLNAIGLENPGIDIFLNEKLPLITKYKCAIIVNILGDTVKEYEILAEQLDNTNVSAIEVNISCPNVKKGGVAFGTDAKMVHTVTKCVRKKTKKTLIIKLSPNVTDITEMAAAAADGGADAVSLINTLLGMAIDIKTKRAKLANKVGGLSGPAIKPIALRMVWQVAQRVAIPVIGIGGICSTIDVIEYLLAGASAIQVGTANFVSPKIAEDLVIGLEQYMLDNKIENVSEIIGGLVP